ncbi:MAG TPA: glycosyl hydrolase family 18 protein [bacterium]|jgi:spore germination protein YaaH|nr:glycosyl hydrolase family 18 protein [bacterium]
MSKKIKIIIGIFAFALALFTGLWVVGKKEPNERNLKVFSPFSDKSSIFSFFSKEKEHPKKIIYGYLPYWNLNKIKYLQLDKITDIAYFGLYLDGDGNFITTINGEDGSSVVEPGYDNWKNNEDLKNLIKECKEKNVRFALTVIAHSDEENNEFLNCRECWDTLIRNLKIELDEKRIKDVNLNFEHAEGVDEDIAKKFSEFVEYLNSKMDETYGNTYLVVSAFGDSATQKRVSSDLENLGRAADGVFIMAYDYHQPTSEEVGPISPIEGPGSDVKETIKDFLSKVPPNKIILGIPYYGYNWLVEDDSQYAKRVSGSDENGFSEAQSYEDVLETIIKIAPELKWNNEGKSPYFTYVSPKTNALRTVYYENTESLRYKYDLIKEHELGGVGIWALGYDGGYTDLWDLLYEYFVK